MGRGVMGLGWTGGKGTYNIYLYGGYYIFNWWIVYIYT